MKHVLLYKGRIETLGGSPQAHQLVQLRWLPTGMGSFRWKEAKAEDKNLHGCEESLCIFFVTGSDLCTHHTQSLLAGNTVRGC